MYTLQASALLALAALTNTNPLIMARMSCTTPSGSGTCLKTASGCSGGSFYKDHCPGATNIQCCVKTAGVGDKCTAPAGAGTCGHTSTICSGGTYYAGHCAGPSNVQCCVKPPTGVGSNCTAPTGSGTCGLTSTACSGGTYYAGHCPGASNVQCCVKSAPPAAGVGDKCTAPAGSGTCGLTSTACSGGTYYPGHCAGASNVQCCVKGSPTTPPLTPSGGAEKYPINEASIKLIESEEGFRPDFYTIDGHKTIGYGHDCEGAGGCDAIHPPLTQAQGEALFRTDLPNYENCICEISGAAGLNANQYGSLVSRIIRVVVVWPSTLRRRSRRRITAESARRCRRRIR